MDNCTADPWILTTLGAIAERLVSGGTPPTENQGYWAGSMPWITGADFTHSGLAEFRRFVSEEAIERTATSVIDKGALLIVTRTGVGKLAIAPCDIAISQDITGVFPDQNQVDVEFLYHRMRQGVEDLRKLIQGTSINGIVRKDLLNYPLDLPPLTQQHQIAEILSTLDEAIKQTEDLIAKQQRIKTGLMQDLLTRGIDEYGNLRFEQTHQFKDSPLGRIPVEWESGYFESCISGSPKNGIYKPQSAYGEQGTPIIRIDAFGHGDRIKAQSYKRVVLSKSEIEQYRLREGEILINRVNSIQYLAKTALVEQLSEATVFESNMMRLTIDQRRMLPDFALLLLTGLAASRHFLRNAKLAIAQASINQHDVISLPIQRPHLEEQRAICERIASNGGSIKNTFSGLEKLHRVKTALMQDLLTGKRRVNSYVPISSNQPSQGFEYLVGRKDKRQRNPS